MFDLEESIAKWRRQMRTAGLETSALLDELESHLRDDIAGQIHSGTEPARAFELAVQRLGPPGALQVEFETDGLPCAAQLRKWGAIAYAAEMAAYTVLQMVQLLRSRPTHQDFLLGMAGLAATLLVTYAIWRLAPGILGGMANKRVRFFVAIAGCVSGLGWMMIFAWFILPNLVLTPGQFAVVFLWALLPLVALPPLAVGLDQREREGAR
jgi:hypothetical protein